MVTVRAVPLPKKDDGRYRQFFHFDSRRQTMFTQNILLFQNSARDLKNFPYFQVRRSQGKPWVSPGYQCHHQVADKCFN